MKKGYAMILLLIIHLTCAVGGLTLVKLGSSSTTFALKSGLLDMKMHWMTLAGLCLYIISFIMWMVLLNFFDLSYISPIIMGLTQILIVLSAYFILKETITVTKIIGIATILVGVILLNIKR